MKKVLLIGGGGTLGTYTAKELLTQDVAVDIICLEDKTSKNPNLRYYKIKADYDALKEFLVNSSCKERSIIRIALDFSIGFKFITTLVPSTLNSL